MAKKHKHLFSAKQTATLYAMLIQVLPATMDSRLILNDLCNSADEQAFADNVERLLIIANDDCAMLVYNMLKTVASNNAEAVDMYKQPFIDIISPTHKKLMSTLSTDNTEHTMFDLFKGALEAQNKTIEAKAAEATSLVSAVAEPAPVVEPTQEAIDAMKSQIDETIFETFDKKVEAVGTEIENLVDTETSTESAESIAEKEALENAVNSIEATTTVETDTNVEETTAEIEETTKQRNKEKPKGKKSAK